MSTKLSRNRDRYEEDDAVVVGDAVGGGYGHLSRVVDGQPVAVDDVPVADMAVISSSMRNVPCVGGAHTARC